MDLALIGCGSIGKLISSAIASGAIDADLKVIYDKNPKKAEELAALFKKKPVIAKGINGILKSDVGLVIEAASQEVVRLYALKILKSGKSMMIMSVGALADEALYKDIAKTAGKKGIKVYLPSGAVGALDSLKSASAGAVYEVTLATAKPPKAFENAPYLAEKGISVGALKKRTVLYRGSAKNAIRGFPENVNVAATLSLAGVGIEKTKVMVIADPVLNKNIHVIYVKGEFGEFKFRVENLPSKENPKTSYLAALSAIATLKKITSPVEVGT